MMIEFLGYLHNQGVESIVTKCPFCRGEHQVSTILSGCFCGHGMINTGDKDMMEDYINNPIPHSCGKLCGHLRGGTCTHPCSCPCHPGPCPPCTVIIELPCQCGKTKYTPEWCLSCRKAVRCGTDPASIHCDQVCGKKREFCEHTCQAPCHPGKPCPNVPCMFDVVVHCPCGRRSEVQKCLIGASSDENVVQNLSQRTLECDSECRIIQRNRKLAEALKVGPAAQDLPEEVRFAPERHV